MICKYEHEKDCCNASAEQYMAKCKKPCEFATPLTNADHIRNMTDEELAEEFASNADYCKYCEHEEKDGVCGIMGNLNGKPLGYYCRKAALDYLKQPYKED